MSLRILLFLAIIILFLEEEEDEKAFYSSDEAVPDAETLKDKLKEWWQGFTLGGYPIYGTLLATDSDHTAATFYEERHDEIAKIAKKDRRFIYFRGKITDFSALRQFEFSDHEPFVDPLAQILNVPESKWPCFVFFRTIDSGEYILVRLAGMSRKKIIALLREMFDSVRQNKEVDSFQALREFLFFHQLQVKFTMVGRSIKEMGLLAVPELLKAVVGAVSQGK